MRQPEPFFRKSTNCWYLQLGKKQIKLAEERAESYRLWHQIMAEGPPRDEPQKEVLTVQKLVKLFISDQKMNAAAATVQWYERFFDAFLQSLQGDMNAESCRVYHLTSAINAHPDWKPNTKHNLSRAVKRLFKWARQQGYIEKDPMELAPAYRTEVREDYVSPAQMAKIEEHALPDFRDLLVLAWETGMRPQELFQLEARHLKLADRTITFAASEAKGRKAPRVVFLGSDKALEILVRLAAKHPKGALLRSSKGNAWNKMSASCAFKGLARDCGIRTHLGAFRKGYCTEALKAGLDTVTVSGLLGHSNAVMVSKVYAKVQHDKEFMEEAARRVKRLSPLP